MGLIDLPGRYVGSQKIRAPFIARPALGICPMAALQLCKVVVGLMAFLKNQLASA